MLLICSTGLGAPLGIIVMLYKNKYKGIRDTLMYSLSHEYWQLACSDVWDLALQ